jgi:hypothetical protein
MRNPIKRIVATALIGAALLTWGAVEVRAEPAIDYKHFLYRKAGAGPPLVKMPRDGRFDPQRFAHVHWVRVDLRKTSVTPYARQLPRVDAKGRSLFHRQALTAHVAALPKTTRGGLKLAVVVNGGLFSCSTKKADPSCRDAPRSNRWCRRVCRNTTDTWNLAYMTSLDGDSWANAATDQRCTRIRKGIRFVRGSGAWINAYDPNTWRPQSGRSYIQGAGVVVPWADGQAERASNCVIDPNRTRARTILGISRNILHVVAVDEVPGVRGTGITALQASRLLALAAPRAIMLDGGGSTTLWVRGRLVSANNRIDGSGRRRQRAIASVLAIYAKSACRYVPDTPACRRNPRRVGCSIVCNWPRR